MPTLSAVVPDTEYSNGVFSEFSLKQVAEYSIYVLYSPTETFWNQNIPETWSYGPEYGTALNELT